MVAISQYNLDKIEDLVENIGYQIRYEKGNFKTGACLLQHTKVVVVSRFYDLEAKINALVLLLSEVRIDDPTLSDKQMQFLWSIRQTKLKI